MSNCVRVNFGEMKLIESLVDHLTGEILGQKSFLKYIPQNICNSEEKIKLVNIQTELTSHKIFKI